MIGWLKSRIGLWVIRRVVGEALDQAAVEKADRRRVMKAITRVVGNIREGVPTMRNEPVITGGAITIAVAVAAAFGLDLDAEAVAITISTCVAVASFLIRRLVSPVGKDH